MAIVQFGSMSQSKSKYKFHIITQMIINNNSTVNIKLKLPLLCLTYILTLNLAQNYNCTPANFTTDFTNCIIEFNQCTQITNSSSANTNSYTVFRNCQMDYCQRLGAFGQCRYAIAIQLDQQSCYSQCCKDTTFQVGKCNINNQISQSQAQTVNYYLIIILIPCILCLVITTIYFLCKIQCFQQNQTVAKANIIKWISKSYTHHKCDICSVEGALIQSNCQHFFCFNCFDKNNIKTQLRDQCSKCKSKSQLYHLWCDQCHQKYLKISIQKTTSLSQLQLFYNKSKVFHKECLKDALSPSKTQGRLTSITKD